jgi:hypothetical protein
LYCALKGGKDARRKPLLLLSKAFLQQTLLNYFSLQFGSNLIEQHVFDTNAGKQLS